MTHQACLRIWNGTMVRITILLEFQKHTMNLLCVNPVNLNIYSCLCHGACFPVVCFCAVFLPPHQLFPPLAE